MKRLRDGESVNSLTSTEAGDVREKNGRRRGLGRIEFALNLWIQTFSLQFFNERRSIHMK
jgi:hypothetical protein